MVLLVLWCHLARASLLVALYVLSARGLRLPN
jgi:hypothetical protein